ncbi:coenzyme Q-binding protein COQ10, mitochondrial-like isoform X1 [Anopheles albimanus]|uniref:coenzyme Q-binding protein COQ10, mitochondrial-like isoform X1 n=1 Tax=Anopheles albimanus TaxID=7167 RepID=UPI00163F23F9|nr:coenzyme Q-binding protein COQ10, mitochondrial-like isoform X1 [Anopheles albimanus]
MSVKVVASAKHIFLSRNLAQYQRNPLLLAALFTHSYSTYRGLFDFTPITKTRREFAQKKLVGYSMQQLYSVVADVEKYYTFVPFCKKSYVYDRKLGSLKADLIIGFPPLNESYTSNVTLVSPTLVRAECVDGRLFNYLLTAWQFSPGLKDIPQSCVIDFMVSFEFKSLLHSQLSNLFFDQLVKQMEYAFIQEAEQRYGLPAIKSHILVSNKS